MTCEETHELLAGAGLDLFTPAIGTVHGRRGGEASIDWELAEWLDKHCSVPLALHGATGLPRDVAERRSSVT